MCSLIRIARWLHRELWRRQLPHGLLSWRYALPGQDEQVRVHARLWWESRSGCPRPVWLIVEFWLWFRWVAFAGWRACWRAMRRWGDQARTHDGVSRWEQTRKLIGLSIGNCVTPKDVYCFHLFHEPERAWDIVFDHEIQAYHRWRSRLRGQGNGSRALLADKLRQTQVLTELGVPMAPILACISQGKSADITTWLKPGTRLFCKTRSGNRGIGAFAVWQTEAGIQGRRFSGEPLPDMRAVSHAWRDLVDYDDALIQPGLLNHPRLAPMAEGDDAITVRYISRLDGSEHDCVSATLEVPAGWDGRGRPLYVILPIAPDTGVIHPYPDRLTRDTDAKQRHAAVLGRLPTERAVPDWELLVDASRTAHELVPDLWAVAWDWVLTPAGPRLLEGNSGWGGTTPQLLRGGFLRRPS